MSGWATRLSKKRTRRYNPPETAVSDVIYGKTNTAPHRFDERTRFVEMDLQNESKKRINRINRKNNAKIQTIARNFRSSGKTECFSKLITENRSKRTGNDNRWTNFARTSSNNSKSNSQSYDERICSLFWISIAYKSNHCILNHKTKMYSIADE